VTKTPTGTYRLQLRGHMDFARAAALLPYLAKLGISHLYLSPMCMASPGSMHGYDAIDFNAIDPAIGGEQGFRTLRGSLEREGLGLIVDVVPNHMAASPSNRWWHDLLEWGGASAFAGHFDVDWSAPKLLLPVLGAAYGEVLADGLFKLRFDPSAGTFALAYHHLALPLTPPSYAVILERAKTTAARELAGRFKAATPATALSIKAELAARSAGDCGQELARAASLLQADLAALDRLHDLQPWRLTHWRLARESLTYRRFFEISDLVAMRVEDPAVFRDVHQRVLALVSESAIAGLRIDHIDGLADPLAYLQRLRLAIGKDCYLVVEKILGAEEQLPEQWPVAGTTGYEFIRMLADVLVDRERLRELTRGYAAFTGGTCDWSRLMADVKRRTFVRNLAAELATLSARAFSLAQQELRTRDLGLDSLRTAIVEIAVALPVYRTYVDEAGVRREDQRLIEVAAQAARATREVEDPAAIDFVVRLLTLAFRSTSMRAGALTFARRWQQTTGPLMAKAVEDTLFYRYNPLIALNEVGDEPGRLRGILADVHSALERRRATQPLGLNATSTHDTKRGEDARARLYGLSEIPELWLEAVGRWTRMNGRFRQVLADGTAPEPNLEWLFYQSLIGAWPPDLVATDDRGMRALKDRITTMMLKAAREAKLRTSWTRPDKAYERAISAFIARVLDTSSAPAFVADFAGFAAPLFVSGALNGLTQALFKLVAPGVPDIYQGAELWDLSLVDPDNRRDVDFRLRSRLLEEARTMPPDKLIESWQTGAIKLRLIEAGLRLRRRTRGWADAAYIPLVAEGERSEHIVAFARMLKQEIVIAVGVRLPCALLHGSAVPLVPPRNWGETWLRLPLSIVASKLLDCITGDVIEGGRLLPVAALLARFPVALLLVRRPQHAAQP
jgi:(1->4)-alpha-D-glucan 1-alpha-D-glucosylmutase